MLTNCFKKIIENIRRINLIMGGQGAGKTYAICQIIANECTHRKIECYVIGAEKTKLNDRALRDMIKICQPLIEMGFCTFTQNSLFKFKNGSSIKFIGLDKEERGKSIRCDIVYFNELNEIRSFKAFDMFASRAKVVFADYNPSEKFFLKELKDNYSGMIREVRVNWEDNCYLSEEEKEAIRKYKENGENEPQGTYRRYMYEVYYLGNYAEIGSELFPAIYKINLKTFEEVDAVENLGLDFGDTTDPNTVVGVKHKDNCLYIREYFYKSMVADSTLSGVLEAIQDNKGYLIYETATAGNTRIVNMYQNKALKLKSAPVIKQNVVPSLLEMCKYDAIYIYGENALHEFSVAKIDKEDENHTIDAVRYVDIMKRLNLI